ncbi:hypothetical protein BCON_0284g00060 [Botryotinia convoluta]|uniref:Uncharacterized protein n=1 Tax=Botryotinia convoluta TaxID=54673 RepID=A0A4Z1HE40_9HELO|nr:hypothetical protein BCON_0284g00060 [Botryotinia convoluta]
MAPPHASGTKDDQDKSSNRKGASIRNKKASGVNKPSGRKTRASGQMVSGPRNSKSNTTPAPHAKSSRLSEGPASEISQDDSLEGESSTRTSIPRAATRQPIPPPVHSNQGEYVESPQLTSFTEDSPVAQHLRMRDWDLNGAHNLTSREQLEHKAYKADRAKILREEEISRRRTAIHPEPEPIRNTPNVIQARRQKRAHGSSRPRPKSTGPQPLSAAVMASLAAEKAKYKEEELAAKRQYIDEHNGGGWDNEDYEEVGLRGGRSEKGAVTPTSSPVLSSQSRTDSESTVSGDSPVEATGPTMASASRPVEAAYSLAHSDLASQPPSEHDDAPVDFDGSAMSAVAESVTPPSPRSLLTAGSLGNGRGKAVAVDEDEESTEDPTSDDDITDHYRDSIHTNGQSTMALSSHGPVEREAKKMPPGHIAIGEETHSQAQILVGAPQPEALTITIRTEKRDEHDVIIARALVTHKYTKGMNWANAKDVKCLNKWRSQILVRAFKAKHERRWKYTLSEMNALCHFLETQLAAPGVDGLMTNVDWAWVTTNYNDFFHGKRQCAGELYASASYTGDDGKKTSAAGQPMKDDRDAPFRSEIALKNQIYHFRDQRAVDLVKNSRGVRPWNGPQEPAGDEPQEDAENIPSVFPSERSSPSSNGPLKKLIFKFGNGSKVTLENKKRTNDESQTDEEMFPPSKKTKMSGPSHLRGGSGNIGEGSESNFDYSEDAAPLIHYQGRELRSDSPFRQGSPSQTARAFSNAQRVLGQGRTAHGVNNQPMIAQSTSLSRSQQGSREIEESYDDDSDDECTSSSHKANVRPRLPQEAQFLPVYSQACHPLPVVRHPLVDAQGIRRRPRPRRPLNIDAPQRHLLPNGPLLPAQHGSPQTAPTSNNKKRARDDGTADMGNNNQPFPSKRSKLQDQDQEDDQDEDEDQQDPIAGGPNQIFLALFLHNSSVANREAALRLRLRAPMRGPQVVTRTLRQTEPRLPTLDDYFAED